MKAFKRIAAAGLGLLLSVEMPMKIYAETTPQTEYVSDLMIAYSDTYEDAKLQLEAQGYTAVEQPLSDSYNTWIGYKTTTDVKDAIRDVSVMNMDGGYSFEEYQKVLDQEKGQIAVFLDSLIPAIEEYKSNYNAGSEKAKLAYTYLNYLTDDDKNGMGMGDYFLADINRYDLQNVLLQCSTYALKTMISCLGLGCSENNWIEQMQSYEVQDHEKASAEDLVSTNMEYLQTLSDGLNKVAEFNITYDQEDTDKIYYEDFVSTASDEEMDTFTEYYSAYTILNKAVIDEEEGTTLADIYMQDPSAMSQEDLEVYYPMFLSMSKGQLGTLSGFSLARSIAYTTCDRETIAEAVSEINEYAELHPIETISVFEGVDRSVFTEKNIAMTSAAMRANALDGSSSSAGWNKTAVYTLGGISAAMGVAAAVVGGLWVYGKYAVTEEVFKSTVVYELEGFTVNYTRFVETPVFNAGTMQALGTTFAVVTTVAVLTAIAAVVLRYAFDMKEPAREKTAIPAIIIDEDSNERLAEMISYHAVKDTNGNCADLADNKETEWYALYWTKKEAAGTPMTADFLTTTKASDDTIDQTKYRPVHMMGSISTSCFNVSLKSGTQNYLYIGYVSADAAETENNAATAVSYGGYAIAGLGGALLGSLITFLAGKKRIKA